MSSPSEPAATAGVKRPRSEDEESSNNSAARLDIKTETHLRLDLAASSDEDAEIAGKNGESGENDDGLESASGITESNTEPTGNEEIDEEEEEEEEDEEEDDDDVGVSRKAKRRRANQFLDIEAEVDDEEEDELDEDDEEAELLREQFILDDHVEKDTALPDATDDRLHREYDQRRQKAEDQDAEELAETLKQRACQGTNVERIER